MSAKGNAPVVIVKKVVKGGGDGHHGGAWKVAYADFVTAMMAFFMLMWLLNATTEKQRKGIADYFNPTIPINRVSGGGSDALNGDSILAEQTLARNGTGATRETPSEEHSARGEHGASKDEIDGAKAEAEQAALESIEEMLNAKSGESTLDDGLARHVTAKITDEGLVIELYDLTDATLFEGETDEPTETLVELAMLLGKTFRFVENQIAVKGHTRSRPIVAVDNPVWMLSSARADRVRQLMESGGLATRRIERVTGYADRKPAVGDPLDPRNNRIELVLLRAHPR